jgi:uncharacterized protein (DUF1778 family)
MTCNDGVITLSRDYHIGVARADVTYEQKCGSKCSNIRIKPATRNFDDRAAEVTGKSRTDFMLEASERCAEEVLLDRTIFTVSPEV